MISAGILKWKIDFYSPTHEKTLYGGKTKTTYSYSFSTRANMKYVNGNRVLENGEIFFDNTLTFIVRYYVNVEEEMRIYFENRKYRILSIAPDKNFNQKVITVELINE